MQRVTIDGIECIKAYHTQECRPLPLRFPVKCNSDIAWLGPGYYFWVDEFFAINWGQNFKKRLGSYNIYQAYIEDNNLLNYTFCEEDYLFLKSNIEKIIKKLFTLNAPVNLKEVHRLLADKFWLPMGINGIIYDDLPNNSYKKNRSYSLLEPFYYIKRIQIVVFNKEVILNFADYLTDQGI